MKPWEHRATLGTGPRFSLLWPLLGVVVLIALSAVIATELRGSTGVVVAKHAIPPFTRLTPADLEAASVGSEGFAGSGASVAELEGKYTTGAIAGGERIEASDVLALRAGGAGRLRFQIQPDRTEALDLEPGELVRLWFSPSDEGGKPAAICALLLAVPDSDSAAEQTYVVGIGTAQAHTLIAHLGRSRLLLSRPG